jgi:hypothetical protein
MVDFYPVHMPEDSSPGHCLATFSTTISSLSIELGTYFDNQMKAKYGHHWFGDLCEARLLTDTHYIYKSPFDFSWIINEPFRYVGSPIREYLPKNEYQFYPSLKKLLETRNKWYHDHNPHNIAELRNALSLVKYVADKCGLELAEELAPVISRVNAIAAGSYKVREQGSTPNPEPDIEVANAKAIRQSAVGAAWLGSLGDRKIQLSKTGSLIDLAAAKNVTSEVGEASTNRYYKLWRALELDWLWVDANGSVAANVLGSLRMVGYWGSSAEETEQDPFAKFLLPRSYTLAGAQLHDRDSMVALDESAIGAVTKSTIIRAKTSVQDGEIIRVTWDGDMIHFGDSGPEYIGEVESKDWFAGHFFVPTAEPE